ncbi:MAG: hypothetical protein EOO27_09205 [Comamonadaceae bacterium]|nr:MAG: hypothetical protein EOO27_09205 [Comamonadaceae bacterium]
MIESHPKDDQGKLLMFPCAPCAQPAEHFAKTLRHLLEFAQLDAGHSCARAIELARDNKLWFADLPAALDVELARLNIARPAPFIETPSKLPVFAKGRRGLPKRRYFHDTL